MSYVIHKHATGYEVIIPAKKYYLLLIPRILIVLLSMAFIGLLVYSFLKLPGFTEFMINDISHVLLFSLFLLALLAYNLYLLFLILWSLRGKEVIYLTKDFIIISRVLFFEIKHRIYAIDKIKNMNVVYDVYHSMIFKIIYSLFVIVLPMKEKFESDLRLYGVIGGIIEFEYENRKICFGINLEHEEGRALIKEFKEFLEYNL